MYLLLLCSFSLVVERLAVKNIQVQLPKGRRFNPYKERKNTFYKCYKKYYNLLCNTISIIISNKFLIIICIIIK